MKQEYVMGNGAIALGALAAGVNVAAGYPGTPSSEIIETLSKYTKKAGQNTGDASAPSLHIEWSVNEKAAMEVAASAAYSGARTLVTMKQVGLNVASDPLMSLAYVGVKGGMVIVSADDPGPISSQTEQDTRMFAAFCRIPVFDPSSPEDAYTMIQDAFEYSEKYRTPVLLRPTTRVCHAYASIEIPDRFSPHPYEGFVKDSKKWVIFPRLSFLNHAMIEKRNPEIGDDLSGYAGNLTSGSGKKAVFASGVSYAYAKEYLQSFPDIRLCRIATPYPFPERLVLSFLEGVEEALCIEELSPFVESELLRLIGAHGLSVRVYGKLTGHIAPSGENSADSTAKALSAFLGTAPAKSGLTAEQLPALPMRPPVLCAGCPHRASFYAVKKAMLGRKSYFCGDIGCYTLGNAMPLDMVDTCLCMGAGVTMAQGFSWVDADGVCFAFIGDSTFFASGMTGVVNAVYNNADIVLCVLDNSTTAMTGHQPHPGTGINMMGNVVDKVSIEAILSGMGVKKIVQVDPLDLDASVAAVRECADLPGVKAVIFKSPCIAVSRPDGKMLVTDACIGCKKCIREIGCPALVTAAVSSPAATGAPSGEPEKKAPRKVAIDPGLCTGCGLCAKLCPVNAIVPPVKAAASTGTAQTSPASASDTPAAETASGAGTAVSCPKAAAPCSPDLSRTAGSSKNAFVPDTGAAASCPDASAAEKQLSAERNTLVASVLSGSAFRKDILICGVGGQGTVLASKLIASAAMHQGAVVHSAETIGMAQRGGSVTSHVRIGNGAYSPLIPAGSADLMLAFEPAEAVRNLHYLKKNGTVIVNRVPVMPTTEALHETGYDGSEMIDFLQRNCSCIVVDADALCAPLGSSRYFNAAILGVAVGSGKSGLSAETVLQEIEARVPEKFVEINKKAFQAGLSYALHNA